MGSIVGEIPDASKFPSKLGPGKGKGLITGQVPIAKKCPILLREDSQYALKQLSSIIKENDYDDLGNHATKAMGETAFSIWHKYAYPSLFFYSVLLLSRSNTGF